MADQGLLNARNGGKRQRVYDGGNDEVRFSDSDFNPNGDGERDEVYDAGLQEVPIPKPDSQEKRNPPGKDPNVKLKWEFWEEENKTWVDDCLMRDVTGDDEDHQWRETADPSPAIILPLLRFQKEFLAWALKQERSEIRGGILADEMGMGKTIQAISLVLTCRDNKIKFGIRDLSSSSSLITRATLVICPVVAVIQWVEEIERYTEKGSARVLVYHGPKRVRADYDFTKYDFVITTYSAMQWEYRTNIMPEGEECRYCGKKYTVKGMNIHLKYHCGPNVRKTEKHAEKEKKKKKDGEEKGKEKKEKKLDKKRRKVEDVVDRPGNGPRGASLLHSVKWERIILDEAHFIKDRNSKTARAVFALDSLNKWALSGTPLQNRVGELYSLVRFLQVYPYANYFCKDCDCHILDHISSSDQICLNCPHSIARHFCWWNRYINGPIQHGNRFDEGKKVMILLKGKVLKNIVLRRTKKGRAADLAFPPRIVSLRRDFLDENEKEFYEALYTKSRVQFDGYVGAGTLMNNYAHIFALLTRLRQAVDHPYLVVYSKTGGLVKEDKEGTGMDEWGICHEPEEDVAATSSDHVFCKACSIEFSATLGNESCPSCSKPLTADLTTNNSGERNSAIAVKGCKHSGILNRLKIADFKTSTKIDALKEEIRNMVEDDNSAKGIVFSQFTSFLDLINYSLQMADIKCLQLVGSMSLVERGKAIKTFIEDADCKIFLMSLKAGGVAINLTVASYVFLMDPWWNPAVERQAQDRVYRIGQYKPVRIVRFVIEDTIEERILKLQERKELVFEGTIGDSKDAFAKLTEEDLRFLFQI